MDLDPFPHSTGSLKQIPTHPPKMFFHSNKDPRYAGNQIPDTSTPM